MTTILALILTMQINFGQTTKDNETHKRINSYLAELEKVGFYGSVLVEIKGKKVISKGYGFSDVEKKNQKFPKDCL